MLIIVELKYLKLNLAIGLGQLGDGLKKSSNVAPIPEDYSDGVAIMANKNIYGEMEKAGDVNVQPFFGLDQYLTKFPVDYSPMFEKEVIEKTDTHIVYKDEYGVTNKSTIDITTLPMEIDNPVKDWKTWLIINNTMIAAQ